MGTLVVFHPTLQVIVERVAEAAQRRRNDFQYWSELKDGNGMAFLTLCTAVTTGAFSGGRGTTARHIVPRFLARGDSMQHSLLQHADEVT